MSNTRETERRWLRSVIAASAEPLPNFPWMRGQRRRPEALQDSNAAKSAIAVRSLPFGRSASLAAR